MAPNKGRCASHAGRRHRQGWHGDCQRKAGAVTGQRSMRAHQLTEWTRLWRQTQGPELQGTASHSEICDEQLLLWSPSDHSVSGAPALADQCLLRSPISFAQYQQPSHAPTSCSCLKATTWSAPIQQGRQAWVCRARRATPWPHWAISQPSHQNISGYAGMWLCTMSILPAKPCCTYPLLTPQ